jgi:hypothetical protein
MKRTEKPTDGRPRQRPSVKVVVTHAFVGDKTLAEAFIPVITEDLRRKAEECRTFDNECDTA